jgi:hypothetical protein
MEFVETQIKTISTYYLQIFENDDSQKLWRSSVESKSP